MKICYLDESGGFEIAGSSPGATPLMALLGLIVDHEAVNALTRSFLQLRQRYYPSAPAAGKPSLDAILYELKGSDLRKNIKGGRNARRRTIRFLQELVDLLIAADAKIVGRVWIKAIGTGLDPRTTYTFAVQDIAAHFEHYLQVNDELGILLCDARSPASDVLVGHSVFTQKHKAIGDAIPHIVEAPVFGRSQNYAGIQIADLLVSAIVFPSAAQVYCAGHGASPHQSPKYEEMRVALRSKVKRLRYGYQDATGKWRGGIVVSDGVAQRPSGELFK